jgi:hypothetical protein
MTAALKVSAQAPFEWTMVSTTNSEMMSPDVIEDRALRWLSIVGLSLSLVTVLIALALSVCASHP